MDMKSKIPLKNTKKANEIDNKTDNTSNISTTLKPLPSQKIKGDDSLFIPKYHILFS